MIPKFASENGHVERGKEAGEGTAAGLLRRGQAAARRGEFPRAARLLRAALLADPTNVEARLWLAAIVEDARESVQLLTEILQDHPDHVRAAAGLRWAYERLESQRATEREPCVRINTRGLAPEPVSRRRGIRVFATVASICLLVILVGAVGIVGYGWVRALGWPGHPPSATPLGQLPEREVSPLPVAETGAPTAIPLLPSATPTATPTAMLSPTATTEPSVTPSPSATLPPTAIPPTPTLVAEPTSTPKAGRSYSGKWIEVILSKQTLIAWEDQTPVRRMTVSTGRSGTPTVTGTFRIYQKLVRTTMAGPGYYLTNVPHTMYFYKGYALHGAYWHNNFGTPMSHGCVNLKLDDAAWLFAWTNPKLPAGSNSVNASATNPGTLVVIHY